MYFFPPPAPHLPPPFLEVSELPFACPYLYNGFITISLPASVHSIR